MDTLFSPWRMQFILQSQDAGEGPCILCALGEPGRDEDRFILHRGRTAYVVLNLYPYNTGHVMVVPYRHLARLGDLNPAERGESLELLARCEGVLTRVYRPQGFNMGANIGKVAGAGIPAHLHFHLLPRWEGDTNFLPVFGRTKSIPEALDATYARLKGAWDA